MEQVWKLTQKKQVGLLTFCSYPKNFLNEDVMLELNQVLDQIEQDESIRVVIINSEIEHVFISGADVNIFKNENEEKVFEFIELSSAIFERMEHMEKPFIAAINGVCLGGGCEFALACDIRVASIDTKIGLPEIIYGLIPGGGGIKRLMSLVPKGQIMRMLLTGNSFQAREAQQMGLVDVVTSNEELLKEAYKIANRIAMQSPRIVKKMKALVQEYSTEAFERTTEKEIQYTREVMTSDDCKEGLDAFFHRRLPKY